MGRTKRNRLRKLKNRTAGYPIDENLIDLQKWLKRNHWLNTTKLRIKVFPETGRGVTSTKSMREQDTLIKIPYDLMITFTTIQTHFKENQITLTEKLTMQDFLVLFLMLERQNETSSWKEYIKSLPTELPDLPWLRSTEEVNLYPASLRMIARKNLKNFETSLERVRKSIGKHLHCVSFEDLFKWAYVLVNTRSVYVDPNVVWDINHSLKELVIDEPSQALCPFLDMFNHDSHVNTEANLRRDDEGLVYELKTLTSFKAHEEILISYGSHNNDTLLMEYGFFLPCNIVDTVRYHLIEIKAVIRFDTDLEKYQFIKDHNFGSDLYIGLNGVSFNLKALLYLTQTQVDVKKCASVIFGDAYPEEFEKILKNYTNKLLDYSLRYFVRDLSKFVCNDEIIDDNKLLENYLMYKICFAERLLILLI